MRELQITTAWADLLVESCSRRRTRPLKKKEQKTTRRVGCAVTHCDSAALPWVNIIVATVAIPYDVAMHRSFLGCLSQRQPSWFDVSRRVSSSFTDLLTGLRHSRH